jgi:hypothetical protein
MPARTCRCRSIARCFAVSASQAAGIHGARVDGARDAAGGVGSSVFAAPALAATTSAAGALAATASAARSAAAASRAADSARSMVEGAPAEDTGARGRAGGREGAGWTDDCSIVAGAGASVRADAGALRPVRVTDAMAASRAESAAPGGALGRPAAESVVRTDLRRSSSRLQSAHAATWSVTAAASAEVSAPSRNADRSSTPA